MIDLFGNYSELIRLLALTAASLGAIIALEAWDKYVQRTLRRIELARNAEADFHVFADRILSDLFTPGHIRKSITTVRECIESEELAKAFANALGSNVEGIRSGRKSAEMRARLTEEITLLETNRPDLAHDFDRAIMSAMSAICLRYPEAATSLVYIISSGCTAPTIAAQGVDSFETELGSPRPLAACGTI